MLEGGAVLVGRVKILLALSLATQSCGGDCEPVPFDLQPVAHTGLRAAGDCRTTELETGVVWGGTIDASRGVDSLDLHLTIGEEVWTIVLEPAPE